MEDSLPLFSAYGVELEYMIVSQHNLSVLPISDQLIYEVVGEFKNEIAFDPIAWSNELVLHVIELKTNGPAKTLVPLAGHFQQEIKKINQLLGKYAGTLLPTGAHPWMDPSSEAKLWPHGYDIIYETYDKIFNCQGHGWSNLQSVHLNLPFANDDEFSKLHTAIRLILPIIPALSASTPVIEGRLTGLLDTRLEFYRLNQQKIPAITGKVIPELVFSKAQYHAQILEKMYHAIANDDPEKILQEEWLNSRGAIARFDRNTIEIRIIDTQECPMADLAIISFIVVVLKMLVAQKWQSFSQQSIWSEERLANILLDAIKYGLDTIVRDEEYATIFGLPKQVITIRDILQQVYQQVAPTLQQEDPRSCYIIQTILTKGNLAQRIIMALQENFSAKKLIDVYGKLAVCLQEGELFLPC